MPVFGDEADRRRSSQPAGCRLDTSGKHPKQGVLSGSFNTRDPHHLSRVHGESGMDSFTPLGVRCHNAVEYRNGLARAWDQGRW